MKMRAFFVTAISLLVVLPAATEKVFRGGKSNNDRRVEEQEGTTTKTTTRLSNGVSFPLVGMGVGNLAHENIPSIIASGLNKQQQYRLIDTASASRNEEIISKAIFNNNSENEVDVIHVVTKIWYTHLGFERTKKAVMESRSRLLMALDLNSNKNQKQPELKIHILIHWPRCDDRIEWMNCQEEEDNLDDSIKKLSDPSPLLDKQNAWKASWRALEGLYSSKDDNNIASIGVSNFDLPDLKELFEMCVVKPHIYQGNVWLLMFHPDIVALLLEHDVLYQAYNVMNGILFEGDANQGRKTRAPNAMRQLEMISTGMEKSMPNVLLAFFVQHHVAVIPRTASEQHLLENSPLSIETVPLLDIQQRQAIETAVGALLRGEDIESNNLSADPLAPHVLATFENVITTDKRPVQLFWIHEETGDEIAVSEHFEPGERHEIKTHPGHSFVAYDALEKKSLEVFHISADYGGREHFNIEL